MTRGYSIQISGLRRHYRRRNGSLVRAIDGIDLQIAAGEFVVLLGASGCGKTTLLRSIAGLEKPDTGAIHIDGRSVFDAAAKIVVPPERRRIGMMFQSYALWPHMTIHQNIQFPLTMQAVPRGVADDKIARVVEMMRLGDLVQQYPNQLSGGQQQRVALARAMVCSDNLLLFDEPLSNVDAKVREHLRTEIGLMQRELGFTAVYVTHDQEEAMALADRIVILGGGRIWQAGTPGEVYSDPRDARVAAFVGAANIVDGTLGSDEGEAVVHCALGALRLPTGRIKATGANVAVVSRPERWRIGGDPPAGFIALPGTVRLATHFGSHIDYFVELAGMTTRIRDYGPARGTAGDAVMCSIDPRDILILDHDADTEHA